MASRFGALAEGEYDKIAPVIACTLPALTDSIPERKRGQLAGEVTSELQVVGKAASIAIQTWVRNNDKTHGIPPLQLPCRLVVGCCSRLAGGAV